MIPLKYIVLALTVVVLASQVDAQVPKVVELREQWSKLGLGFVPKDPILYRNKTRMFATVPSWSPGAQFSNNLMLFDLENNVLIRAFGYGHVIDNQNDSVALIINGTTLRVIRVDNGVQIDSLPLGTLSDAFPLTNTFDTVAITYLHKVYIVDIKTHDTLSSAAFPHPVSLVSRIPETDTVIVSYEEHREDSRPRIHGQAYCSMRDMTSGRTLNVGYDIYAISRHVIRYAFRYFDSRPGRKLDNVENLQPLRNGRWVRLESDSVTRIRVLTHEMDTLFTTVLVDALNSLNHVVWDISSSTLGIATDSVIWEIDTEALTATRRVGLRLPKYVFAQRKLRSGALPVTGTAKEFHFLDFSAVTVVHPFQFDLLRVLELKPNNTPYRIAFGERVIDLSASGNEISSTRWRIDTAAYSYMHDFWWKAYGPYDFRAYRTLDTIPTITAITHADRLIDVHVQSSGNSYVASDASGRVLEWTIPTHALVRVVRKPPARVGAEMYVSSCVDDSTCYFVERDENGKLVFGRVNGDASEQIVLLSNSPLDTLPFTAFDSVLFTGPTEDGSYIVQHPLVDSLYLISSDFSVRTIPFRHLRGLLALNERGVVLAIDSSLLLVVDASTYRITDSVVAHAGYIPRFIERSDDSEHVLISVRQRGNVRSQRALYFSLKWMDVDKAVFHSPIDGHWLTIGDNRSVVTSSSLYSTTLLSIESLDTIVTDRFNNWLPPLALPTDYQRAQIEFSFGSVRAVSMSVDERSLAFLAGGKQDAVICQSPAGTSIHYHYPISNNYVSMYSHSNGRILEVLGPLASTLYDAQTFEPVATISEGLGTTGQIVHRQGDIATSLELYDTQHFIRELAFTRRLGSLDTFGNVLQMRAFPKPTMGKGGNAMLLGDGVQYIFGNDSITYVANTSDARVLDTIVLPFKSLTRSTSANGRLLSFVGGDAILFYDTRMHEVVGETRQFFSVQEVRWSQEGYRFFVWHNFTQFGAFDFDATILSAEEFTPTPVHCPFSIRVENGALEIINSSAEQLPYRIQLFDLSGSALSDNIMASTSSTTISLEPYASQLVLVRCELQSSSCTFVVPLAK